MELYTDWNKMINALCIYMQKQSKQDTVLVQREMRYMGHIHDNTLMHSPHFIILKHSTCNSSHFPH